MKVKLLSSAAGHSPSLLQGVSALALSACFFGQMRRQYLPLEEGARRSLEPLGGFPSTAVSIGALHSTQTAFVQPLLGSDLMI